MNFYPNRRIQCKDIRGLAAGGTAQILLPKGPRYKRIALTLGNSAAANGNAPAVSATVGDIRVTLGSQIIRTASADEMDKIYTGMGSQYGSQPAITGGANGTGRTILPIWFEEPWRKREEYQNGLAVQTGWLGQNDVFMIECDIVAGITPVLTVQADVDDFDTGQPNRIVKWFRKPSNTNDSTLALQNIFQGAPLDDAVSQLTFFDTSDAKTVDKVRFEVAGRPKWEDITKQENIVDLKGYDMNPAAGSFHLVWDHDDMFESMQPVRDLQSTSVLLTFSAASAGTINRIEQRYGLPTAQ